MLPGSPGIPYPARREEMRAQATGAGAAERLDRLEETVRPVERTIQLGRGLTLLPSTPLLRP